MLRWARVLLLLVLLVAGCAPRPSPTAEGAAPPPPAPKRITVGVQSEFNAVATRVVRSGAASRPGVTEIEALVHAGLTQTDHAGMLQGELAEAVPSTANGLWKVFADGRMETTWRIRDGAVWQDGAPFTAEDLVFTAAVSRDPELPLMRNSSLALVEGCRRPIPAPWWSHGSSPLSTRIRSSRRMGACSICRCRSISWRLPTVRASRRSRACLTGQQISSASAPTVSRSGRSEAS